jgi:hypothetical protein
MNILGFDVIVAQALAGCMKVAIFGKILLLLKLGRHNSSS